MTTASSNPEPASPSVGDPPAESPAVRSLRAQQAWLMSHLRRYLVAEQRLVDMFVHEDDPAVAEWNAARASLRRLANASESQMARQAAAYEAEIAARALAELDPLLEITREPDGSWGVGMRVMPGHVGGGVDLPAAAAAAADAAAAWIEAYGDRRAAGETAGWPEKPLPGRSGG